MKNGMTVKQLEGMLRKQQTKLRALHQKRSSLTVRLARVMLQINTIAGKPNAHAANGTRVKNEKPLVDYLEQVLRNGKPQKVGSIVDGVRTAGYRTNSANFRVIVNQTLIKEKQFISVGRGEYRLRAHGKPRNAAARAAAATTHS